MLSGGGAPRARGECGPRSARAGSAAMSRVAACLHMVGIVRQVLTEVGTSPGDRHHACRVI
eukprot:7384583-Prymnesium_polylepis.1